MQLADYLTARPYAYHLTSVRNLPGIRKHCRLYPAAHGLIAMKMSLTSRRPSHIEIEVAGSKMLIRDQAPLYEGNCKLGEGWDFARFVEELNQRVFFWPGREDAPISYGMRHFARYADEKPTVLRIPVADLIAANPNLSADVCKFNSGSPRCSNGQKSPRGPSTFSPLSTSILRPSQVVELTFRGHVSIPETAQISQNPTGPWGALW